MSKSSEVALMERTFGMSVPFQCWPMSSDLDVLI